MKEVTCEQTDRGHRCEIREVVIVDSVDVDGIDRGDHQLVEGCDLIGGRDESYLVCE